ncbi:DUF3365 domain-containing protein, partial [bacterium]|nr:DUF3365 domain-containing protein [bacterium]
MADGGPGGALSVCSEEAAAIADSVGSARGLLVGRTSLRTRNPRNAPDDWERGILLDFAARREQGEKISDLDAWTFESDEDGHRTFRYMRAIVTAPPCLECHGHDLAPEAAAGLAELYPEDTAIGFAVGDIRGAFTTSLPLLD